MIRTVKKAFDMEFSRSGGALITARVDVWKPGKDDWEFVAQYTFSDATQPTEVVHAKLAQGTYTCIFQCFVEESLNGKYKFMFTVDGDDTFADDGDVNTTSAPNDSKVYKDQFIITAK
jgi:hypothetical protein